MLYTSLARLEDKKKMFALVPEVKTVSNINFIHEKIKNGRFLWLMYQHTITTAFYCEL